MSETVREFFKKVDPEIKFIPFRFSDEFVESYASKSVPWDALGEFSYMRTYSRTLTLPDKGIQLKERWHETIRRVVEGVFTFQKMHCHKHKVPWNNTKAQNSAKIMYDLMFHMKFLPPGRGLWMMGTDYVYKRGGAPLNNCFHYDTEIVTEEGVKRIGDCDGTTQRLLTEGCKWVDAPIKCFGKQKLWKLTLSRQGKYKEIITTGDHRWFANDRRLPYRNNGHIEFLTKDLRPDIHSLQYSFGNNVLKGSVAPSMIGVMHGLTYGDGTSVPGMRNSNILHLFGEKMKLSIIFPKQDIDKKKDRIIIRRLPNGFKSLPSIKENSSYLLGWLMGYFAADGSVSNGQIVLCSYNENDLKFVRDVCYKLGIGTYGIIPSIRASNFDGVKRTSYKLTFMSSTLSNEFFLLKKHKRSFSDNTIVRNWKVESVKETNIIDNVYCATVSGIGKFTLSDNIMTGNCAFVSSKNIALEKTLPFEFLMDMSMLGAGVGFDVAGHDSFTIQKPNFLSQTVIVPDTREGWVESMAIVLNGFFNGTDIPKFDYSNIRPEGSIISGFGGAASGPGPLIKLIEFIIHHYEKRVGKSISVTDIVDTFNNIGKCVVSGNVRRSAEIALCNANECAEFLSLKDPALHKKELNEYRWASNNSIICPVGADYEVIAEYIAKNGEPGIVWMQNAREYGRMGDFPNNLDYKADGVNPCVEQTLESYEMCCLVENFPSRHESYDEFQRTLKYSYLYAKTVTLIPTHWEQTNAVMLRNRRIGTSQSGIIDAFAKHGRSQMLAWSDSGYKYIRHMDNIYSDWLCIPRSIKVTSVKPSGTVSLLPNVSPGIHYHEAEYYIRRVVISNTSELVNIMRNAGYTVEVYSYDPDNAVCVEFPVKVENFFKGASEVTMWEQLLNAADYQRFWADNQVSITIRFREHEKKDIANALSIFDTKLKAVSMLPYKDHGYKQAPYEPITKEQYEKRIKGLKKPDYSSFIETPIGEKGCDGDTCQLPKH